MAVRRRVDKQNFLSMMMRKAQPPRTIGAGAAERFDLLLTIFR